MDIAELTILGIRVLINGALGTIKKLLQKQVKQQCSQA
jgi:hypothetical protein